MSKTERRREREGERQKEGERERQKVRRGEGLYTQAHIVLGAIVLMLIFLSLSASNRMSACRQIIRWI